MDTQNPEHVFPAIGKEKYLLKFKEIYKKREGKDLTDQEALQHFNRLVILVNAVYQPMKKYSADSFQCPTCGQKVKLKFADEVSEKEFLISGLCQQCQNKTFK